MLDQQDLAALRQMVDRSSSAGLVTQTVTAAYTMTTADRVIRADATAGAITITLPAALAVVGAVLRIIKCDVSANAVTVATQSPDTIGSGAAATLSLAAADASATLRAYRNGNAVNFDRF